MDVCHNIESLEVLFQFIKSNKFCFSKVYFSFLQSKDYSKMILMLQSLNIPLTLVELDDSRAISKVNLNNSNIACISERYFLELCQDFRQTLTIGCFPLVGKLAHQLKFI